MTIALFLKAGLVSVFIALIDPAWAVPIQTLLLIVLTVVTARVHQGIKRTEAGVERAEVNTNEAKANATHAASAAAAAAAVARDSNRIVKDIGGALRSTTPPEEGHTP